MTSCDRFYFLIIPLSLTPVLGSSIELFIELAGPDLVFDGCFMAMSCHLHHWSYCWGSGVSD